MPRTLWASRSSGPVNETSATSAASASSSPRCADSRRYLGRHGAGIEPKGAVELADQIGGRQVAHITDPNGPL